MLKNTEKTALNQGFAKHVHNQREFHYDHAIKEIPTEIEPHFHNSYELLLFMRGNAVYNVEGQTYELKSNDLLITNPRELHRPSFKSKEVYERAIIFVKPSFLSEFINEEYNPFRGLERRQGGTQNRIDAHFVKERGIDVLINKIGYYASNKLPQSQAMIKACMIELLNEINDSIQTDEKVTKVNNKIFDILSYINQNIFDKITLDMLEKQFYMSKYHISHIFKEQTGLSVIEYITQKRIQYAKDLMMSGVPAGEAAEKAGFTDYSMFYKAFKKSTDTSPRDYIKK